MVCARASAPTKVILFGEHYVVYGAPSIVVPVDRRNEVVVTSKKGNGSVDITSSLGKAQIINGRFVGSEILKSLFEVYSRVGRRANLRKMSFDVVIHGGGAPKGMGNSSSVSAALAAGLYACLEKEYDEDELFTCAQEADVVAHGGRPSGVDARVVVSGSPLIFLRCFEGEAEYRFKKERFSLPSGCALVVIDTYRGKRQTTGELIAEFAKHKGIEKEPGDMTGQERKEVYAEVGSVLEGAMEELKPGGDARKLGELMNRNHELLAKHGVSTDEIEKVREACLGAGAYGAKVTGAGGIGGAAIALVEENSVGGVVSSLKTRGFPAFKTRVEYGGVIVTCA